MVDKVDGGGLQAKPKRRKKKERLLLLCVVCCDCLVFRFVDPLTFCSLCLSRGLLIAYDRGACVSQWRWLWGFPASFSLSISLAFCSRALVHSPISFPCLAFLSWCCGYIKYTHKETITTTGKLPAIGPLAAVPMGCGLILQRLLLFSRTYWTNTHANVVTKYNILPDKFKINVV